jgi:hypothetical protein
MANLGLLPEELLYEILTYCLTQPLDIFMEYKPANPWWRCPGSTGGNESTDILLVCKRWHRVATPLTYRQICLACDQSSAKAARLALTLGEKPRLGKAVRHLKITTTATRQFTSLHDIIKLSPNIEAVYIHMDYAPASHSAIALFSCLLEAMNPSQLYLVDTDTHSGVSPIDASPFYSTLIYFMRTWSALVSLCQLVQHQLNQGLICLSHWLLEICSFV